MSGKKGILLVNLGTPASTSTSDIRTYLNEFLSDPRVIDINKVGRFLLLKLFILPFRPAKIKPAYESIWTAEGSPLLLNTKKTAEALQRKLGEDYEVHFAMRYQQPNVADALKKFANTSEVLVIPMYPQYATSSTGSTLARVYELIAQSWDTPKVSVIHSFYNHPLFIDSLYNSVKQNSFPWDHILFSYHGIPQRHLQKSGCNNIKKECLTEPCPDKVDAHTANFCYRYQCYQTTRLVAEKLGLTKDQYTVSFQSRLGRTPWIKPYTDIILKDLHKKGIRKLAVITPSFLSDCLETIEEVGIRIQEQWKSYGEGDFLRIPCLNYQEQWIDNFVKIVEQKWQPIDHQ